MYRWIEDSRTVQGSWALTKRFFKGEVPLHAAALAYQTCLAVVPAFGIALWYLNYIGLTSSWIEQAKLFMFSHLNVGASTEFIDTFNKLTENVGGGSWGWVGLGLFIYTSFSLLLRIGDSLDNMLRTRTLELSLERGTRQMLVRRFTFLTLFPLVLAASLALMAWLREGSFLRFAFQLKGVGSLLALPIPYLMDAFAVFLVYLYVPNVRITWQQAAKAALIVAPIFNIGKWGMGLYARYALTNQKIYGALAVLPVFVLWIQVAWMIFLFGGLIMDAERSQKKSAKKD